MLFEDAMIFIGVGIIVFLIAIPMWKLFQLLNSKHRDPVKEAKIRLEVAKADAEAAKLNKEAEKVYDDIYHDIMIDEETTNNDRRRV